MNIGHKRERQMGNLFKWASVAVLGLFVALAGIGHVENPDNSILTGVIVLYSGIFIFIIGVLQMLKKGEWKHD